MSSLFDACHFQQLIQSEVCDIRNRLRNLKAVSNRPSDVSAEIWLESFEFLSKNYFAMIDQKLDSIAHYSRLSQEACVVELDGNGHPVETGRRGPQDPRAGNTGVELTEEHWALELDGIGKDPVD